MVRLIRSRMMLAAFPLLLIAAAVVRMVRADSLLWYLGPLGNWPRGRPRGRPVSAWGTYPSGRSSFSLSAWFCLSHSRLPVACGISPHGLRFSSSSCGSSRSARSPAYTEANRIFRPVVLGLHSMRLSLRGGGDLRCLSSPQSSSLSGVGSAGHGLSLRIRPGGIPNPRDRPCDSLESAVCPSGLAGGRA